MSPSMLEEAAEGLGGRAQKEWGWKVAIYMALTSAGAAAYLIWQVARAVDPAFGRTVGSGAILGIVLVGLGGLFILFDLGRWPRFYLAGARVVEAWESRGFVILLAFGVFAVLQVGGLLVGVTALDGLLSALAGLFALAVVPYGGLLLHSGRSFPLWRHPLQVALYPISALLAGFGVLALDPGATLPSGVSATLATAIVAVAIVDAVLLSMLVHMVRAEDTVGLASGDTMLFGDVSRKFWMGAVGVGIAVPIVLGVVVLTGAPAGTFVRLAAAGSILGLLFLRHVMLEAAKRPTFLSFRGHGPWGIAQ